MKTLKTLLASTALVAGTAFGQVPGVTPTTITLGQSAAMSGPAQALGLEMRQGAKVYFDRVNAQGGVNGRKIELVSLDDGYEPGRTEVNTKKLIEEHGVLALFGYVGTPTSLAAMPIFTAAKVPFFAPFTGAEALREPFNRYIFHVRASYYDETEEIVKFILDGTQRRIAVFYQDDSYGKAGLAGVERALAKRQMKSVATGTVQRNTVDVAAAVKQIVAAKPDGVVMISAYGSCAAFVREAKKAGYPGNFYNVSFVGSKALRDELKGDGHGVIISQVVPLPWDTRLPIVAEYQAHMKAAGQTDYSFTSLEGYIAAKVLTHAMRAAGKDLSREKLIDAMERTRELDVGDFVVDFSPNKRAGSKFVDLTIIGRQGKFMR